MDGSDDIDLVHAEPALYGSISTDVITLEKPDTELPFSSRSECLTARAQSSVQGQDPGTSSLRMRTYRTLSHKHEMYVPVA